MRDLGSADDGFGSDSAAAQCPWDVRYPSESCRECGHLRSAGSCQDRTHASQQRYPYSITSSARASSESATVRSSALAVALKSPAGVDADGVERTLAFLLARLPTKNRQPQSARACTSIHTKTEGASSLAVQHFQDQVGRMALLRCVIAYLVQEFGKGGCR